MTASNKGEKIMVKEIIKIAIIDSGTDPTILFMINIYRLNNSCELDNLAEQIERVFSEV